MRGNGRKVFLLAVTALVLLPFWQAGSTGRGAAWLPWQIREVWAFSQLFTHAQPTWTSHHIQLLGRDGVWREVPHDPPFAHELFGSQTRLDWLLIYLQGAPEHVRDAERRGMIYRHLCTTYVSLYAGTPLAAQRLPAEALPVVRVRLVRFERPSSIDRPPATRYTKPLPGPLLPGNHAILIECSARAGEPT